MKTKLEKSGKEKLKHAKTSRTKAKFHLFSFFEVTLDKKKTEQN